MKPFRTGNYIVIDKTIVTEGEVTMASVGKMSCLKLKDGSTIIMSKEDKKRWDLWLK